MTSKVTFQIHTLLGELAQRKGKRYSYAELANKLGMSRQGVRRLLTEPAHRVDLDTLAALCDFFEAEGMDVEPGDLLVRVSDGE